MAGIAAWLWVALASGFAFAEAVVVELRPDVTVNAPLVLVRDIATLHRGTPAQREAIGSLDLVLLNTETPETHISQRLIEVRLLVAGMQPEEAIFIGAESVHVISRDVVQAAAASESPAAEANPVATSQITDQLIEHELEEACGQFLAGGIESVEVHLSQPVASTALRGLEQDEITFQIVTGQNIAPGANSATIQFWRGGELVKAISVRFDLIVNCNVVLLNRFVPRGTAVTADMLSEQVRPVSEAGLLASTQDVVGTETLRDLQAGTVLKGNMLRVARQTQAPVAIRARDLVYVTYNQGGLSLSMADAVAMQEGRVGDMIRIMNPTSRNVFAAVVVGPGHVEVQAGP